MPMQQNMFLLFVFTSKYCKRVFLIIYQRKLWRKNNAIRIGVFWIVSLLTLALVIMIIVTDWVTWDRLNRDFVASTGTYSS